MYSDDLVSIITNINTSQTLQRVHGESQLNIRASAKALILKHKR